MVDRLGNLDAAFLALESNTGHLHVGAVLLLEPPEGTRALFSPSTRFAQVRQLIEHRLHLVPPLRQRAIRVPLGLHRPVWVDDPEFDLEDHLSRASLPSPGGDEELATFVADLMSRPLDPDRPLWEMVLVEGLTGGRSALVAKIHHAMLDGVSGATILAAFLDLNPRPRAVAPAAPWNPPPLPSGAALLRDAAGSLLAQPGQTASALSNSVTTLVDVATHNRKLAEEGSVPPPAPFKAPRTSLNGALSSRRRYAMATVPLGDLKAVRRAMSTTVNDVILAIVGGAVRRLLLERGESPEDPLVAAVPVSTRTGEGDDALGNKISSMLVSLATSIEDPLDRLVAIAQGTTVAKEQERLTKGRLLGDVAQIASPPVVSMTARWFTGLRAASRLPPLYNLMVSSVAAPDLTLWCAGSRVAEFYPVGPVAVGSGLNVTTMSYLDTVHFGLLGCRRLVPDVARLAELVVESADELVAAALPVARATG